MKARVIATGKIVDVVANGNYYDTIDNKERYYSHELDFNDTTDYWTRLEHQYAGMAMQGILSNQEYVHSLVQRVASREIPNLAEGITNHAEQLANDLVEKMKEKEERK